MKQVVTISHSHKPFEINGKPVYTEIDDFNELIKSGGELVSLSIFFEKDNIMIRPAFILIKHGGK